MKHNKMVLRNSAIIKQVENSLEGLSKDAVLQAYNELLEVLESGNYASWSKEYKLIQKNIYEKFLGV